MEILFKSKQKIKYESQEEQLFINQKKSISVKKRKIKKKENKIFLSFITILIIIILLFLFFLFCLKKIIKFFVSKISNKIILYKNKIINSKINTLQYQNI